MMIGATRKNRSFSTHSGRKAITVPAKTQGHHPPAGMGCERRHRRQEDKLTGSIGRGQDADDKSFMRAEPTRGDERRQVAADEASGQADDDAPQQDELQRLTYRRGQRDARGGRRRRQDHRAARPKRSIAAAANGPTAP